MKKLLFTLYILIIALKVSSQRFNEIHYDNAGADAGEFIEVFVPNPQPADIGDYDVVLYNGSSGRTYGPTLDFDTDATATSGMDQSGTPGVFYVFGVEGIQNGAPDGMALVNGSGIVIEFLSYEGTITAANGPANGDTSIDIGASENDVDTPTGTSIQRQSNGTWVSGLNASPGSTNDSSVPVTYSYISVEAQNNSNLLTWSTSSEQNNDYFDVEHSLDGEDFSSIGRVEAKGNTRATGVYEFVHNEPIQGMHYYRLKQVDFDGVFTYSEIRSVDLIKEGKVSIYPSMVQGEMTIRHNFTYPTQVKVYNMSGQEVVSFSRVNSETSLDVTTLKPNIYLVQVVSGSQQVTKRIIKQ